MNDNDVDDLARVLAEHYPSADRLTCLCGSEWHPLHLAQVVLASGVVVSARDVKALADDMRESEELYTVARQFEIAAAVGSCRAQTEALLREPATDAAPTGDTCHVTEVDGEPIRYHGQPMTSEGQEAFAAVVRAAKRRLDAEHVSTCTERCQSADVDRWCDDCRFYAAQDGQ